MQLPDIQDQFDDRGVELDEVGVAGVRYPIEFSDGHTRQVGIATVDFTVRLPADRRGTHMSRMIELIDEDVRAFDPRTLPTVLKAAAVRLDVDAVQILASMPLAFEVEAPVSGKVAYQPCDVTVRATLDGDDTKVQTTVEADVTSLCPCSKAISDYGAHNQRSKVTLGVIGQGDDVYPIPVRRMFEMIRSVGSSPAYPIIKRTDERAVTMTAHDHPAFVEDMARDLSRVCRDLGVPHEIRVRNFESIHSHDAVASVHWPLARYSRALLKRAGGDERVE